MDKSDGRCRDVRRAAWFADSQFSSGPVRQDRAERRVRAHRSRGREAISAVVRIRPVLHAQATRLAREWERLAYRLRECLPNRQDAPDRNRGVRDSVISMGLKKAR